MKTPIAVHALFHSSNVEGNQIYTELYSLLCRDVDKPFSDGLDIPVYFCTGDDNHLPAIVQTSSAKNLYLVFIDINMFCSQSWRTRIKELFDIADDNNIVVGVKQYEHAFSINKKLGNIQSIVVDRDTTKENISIFENDNWEVFTTQLFDLLTRVLKGFGAQKPLTVFISHTKKGENENGEKMAKDVRSFLASDTKLASFFDVHDILDGYDFGKQIKRYAGQSALLALFTNTYSSREWCRIEMLTAKEAHMPIVAVFMVDDNVDRVFPYIGNIPSTVFKGDWRKIINLLLRTALDQCYEAKMLETECDKTTEYLPYPPEAFNMSLIKDATSKLLYPEPPLGNEELRVLDAIQTRIGREITFATPMSHLTENLDLQGEYVGISVSDSADLQNLGIGKEMFKDLTIELSRHILKANGRMIYGGDLRSGGYTEIFKELSCQYGQQEKAGSDVIYFDNYLAWPRYNTLSIKEKGEYLSSRINLISAIPGNKVSKDEVDSFLAPSNLNIRLKWASSLTSMRQQMIHKSFARIVVGGKILGFSGYMAGIVEEFKLSVQNNHPVFVIGGFGGAAHIIGEILEGKIGPNYLLETAVQDPQYKELFEWCESNGEHIDYEALDKIKFSDLHNNLSDEENTILLHSVDIIEIVSLILKGLSKTLKDA